MMLQKSERKSPRSSRKFMLINYSESSNLLGSIINDVTKIFHEIFNQKIIFV